MNTEKTKGRREKAKSDACCFGAMGRGISGMMTKCCAGRGSFLDCSTITEEMKKQHCASKKGAVESGGTKK